MRGDLCHSFIEVESCKLCEIHFSTFHLCHRLRQHKYIYIDSVCVHAPMLVRDQDRISQTPSSFKRCADAGTGHELFSEMSPSSNRQTEQDNASTKQMVNMTIKTTELIR